MKIIFFGDSLRQGTFGASYVDKVAAAMRGRWEAAGFAVFVLASGGFALGRGVSIAWVCAFPPVYALAFRLVLRAIGLGYSQVLQVLRGPVLAAGVMALCVAGLQYWLHANSHLPALVQLLALVAFGAALYPAALWLADRQAFSLLRQRAQLFVSGH